MRIQLRLSLILGLTGPNSKVSLTTKERSARYSQALKQGFLLKTTLPGMYMWGVDTTVTKVSRE